MAKYGRTTKKRESLTVYINLNKVATVNTDAAAWKIILNAPFGALYEVHDDQGMVVERFIPY